MTADIAQIEALEALRAKAILEGDAASLAAFTDDDYVHVEASGLLRTKETFLGGLGGVRGHYERYDVTENNIRIYGDAAVVTGIFENLLVKPDGERLAKRARHVRVYVRRADGWKNVSHQATLID